MSMPEANPQNLFADAYTEDEVLGQMVGAGSMCWHGGTGDSVFDSAQASRVVDAGKERIEEIREETTYWSCMKALEGLPSKDEMDQMMSSMTKKEMSDYGLRKYLLFGPRRWLGGGIHIAGRAGEVG